MRYGNRSQKTISPIAQRSTPGYIFDAVANEVLGKSPAMTRLIRNIFAGLYLVSAGAFAAPVAIDNAGFEDLYFGTLPEEFADVVPATAFPVGPAPTGWSIHGTLPGGASVGVLNPGVAGVNPMATNFPAGAPEGNNVALLYQNGPDGSSEYGIGQQLSATLTANTHYVLTVEVGNIDSGQSSVPFFNALGFFNLEGFPGYRVDLLAGGQVLASDNNSLNGTIAEGEFELSTVVFTSGAAHAQLGQNLEIRLFSLNLGDPINHPGASGVEVDFDDVQLDASAIPVPAGAFLIAIPLVFMASVSRRTIA